MNEVNFLPLSFMNKQACRQRVMRQALLVACLAAVLIVWAMVQMGQTSRLHHYAVTLEREVQAAKQEKNEISKLKSEHALLIHQVKIQQELAQPISHTQVIGLLAEALDPAIGVTGLNMITRRPPPRTQSQSDQHAKMDAKQRAEYDKRRRQQADLITIEFEGIAPDDMAIANLVARLSESQVFDGVQMHFTRMIERDGVIGRKFRLSTKVRLNRNFQPISEEVADAH